MHFGRFDVAGQILLIRDKGNTLDDVVHGGKFRALDISAELCVGIDDQDGHHAGHH